MKVLKILLVATFAISLSALVQAKVLWSNDFSGWRDQSTNPGFDANMKVDTEKKIGTITTPEDTSYGKIMSAEEGIEIEVTEDTIFEIDIKEDIPEGALKINLMSNTEPYDTHEIIPATDKKGIQRVKIAEKTPWRGKHGFWISIWLEGFGRTAMVSDIKITDGKLAEKKVVKKKKTAKKKRVYRKKKKK
ncbi:hypothetical protein K8S19_12420 [bacterium]|nr:hypothetical protein [bacterium]